MVHKFEKYEKWPFNVQLVDNTGKWYFFHQFNSKFLVIENKNQLISRYNMGLKERTPLQSLYGEE